MQDAAYKASLDDWVAAPYADEQDEVAWRACKVARVTETSLVTSFQASPGTEIFERFEHGDVRPIRWRRVGRRQRWMFAEEQDSGDA
jgi:hypothetical protein